MNCTYSLVWNHSNGSERCRFTLLRSYNAIAFIAGIKWTEARDGVFDERTFVILKFDVEICDHNIVREYTKSILSLKHKNGHISYWFR
jgi:hypothetical protein